MEFSKRVKHISDSLTLKINAKAKLLKEKGVKVINFSAGEPDFDTPSVVKDKAKEAIDKGYTKYTPASGIQPLKNAIIKRYMKKYGVELAENCILISSGAKQAIFNIVETLCGPGDEVLIPSPYWVSYPEIVRFALAEPIFIDTSKTEYHLTPKSLENAITERTKLLILNSPCNPTGIVYPPDIMKEITSIIRNRHILCISDEIYDELIYGVEEYKTMLNYIDSPLDNIVIINGVSKSFSMTGWRLGYAIASPSIINKSTKIQAHTTSCASSISQYAALSALEDAGSFTHEMCKAFDGRRRLAIELMSEIDGIAFPEPCGAFYLFFDVSKFYNDRITTSLEMAEYLLDKHNVAVVPGIAFGDDRYLRLSYTLSLEQIREGITRIREGLLNVLRQG